MKVVIRIHPNGSVLRMNKSLPHSITAEIVQIDEAKSLQVLYLTP